MQIQEERETEHRDETETGVEALMDVEEELAHRVGESDSQEEARFEVNIPNPVDGLRRLRESEHLQPCRTADALIVDADISGDRVTFEVEPTPDERVSYTLAVPDSADDTDSKLVRLCHSQGVSLDQLGNLSTLPVIETENGSWALIVPPTSDSKRFVLEVQGHQLVNRRTSGLDSRLNSLIHWFALTTLTSLPFYRIGRSDDDYFADFRTLEGGLVQLGLVGIFTFAGIVGIGLSLGSGVTATVSVGFVASVVATFLWLLAFVHHDQVSDFAAPE